jgi:predicted dehydrogenase
MAKVKIGLIGSQFAGTLHAEALAQVTDAEIVAVCGLVEPQVKEFAAHYRVPNVFGDYKELLKRADVEMVTVAVPNHLHCQVAVDALSAGKHVVVEKPLCLTLEEADRMISAARRAGKPLMYAENLCYTPKYVRAKELVDQGAIGRVFKVRQCEKHSGPHSPWFWDVDLSGGGALFDMGCHGFAFGWWVLGKPAVKYVMAQCGLHVHADKTRGDDDSTFLVEFDNGVIVQVEDSWARPGGMEDAAEIFGSKGVIYCDVTRGNSMQVYSADGYGYAVEKADTTKGWTFAIYEENWQYGYPAEMRHFVDCVRGQAQPITTAEDGRAVLEVMFAAYEAAAGGRRVAFPYKPAYSSRPIESWLRARAAAA